MNLKNIILLATASLIIAACSDNKSGDKGTAGGGGGATGQGTLGNWKASCKVLGNTTPMSMIMLFELSEGTSTLFGTTYGSNDCTGTVNVTTRVVAETQTAGTSATDPSITNVNIKLLSGYMTLRTQLYVDGYNQQAVCGITDWALNVERDISASGCISNIGKTSFSIMKVTGNQAQFGKDSFPNDGSTVDKRHTELDPEIFTRTR